MSGRDFSPSTTVDELQSGDGTALAIGTEYDAPKNSVADSSIDDCRMARSLRFRNVRVLRLCEAGHFINFDEARKQGVAFVETSLENAVEVVHGDWPHRGLCSSRDPTIFVKHVLLHNAIGIGKGNGARKIGQLYT